MKAKEEEANLSFRYIAFIIVMALASVIMIANAMFSVFYSVSNLGVLNLGSVAIAFFIDQIAFRFVMGVAVCASAKIMLHL